MTHHLEPVSDRPSEGWDPVFGPEELDPDEDGYEPTPRPMWWRWLAIAVIIAMVVAGPLAVALHRLLT